MTEQIDKQHCLGPALQGWPGERLALEVREDLGHINLRGNPDDSAFLKAAEKTLGQVLPMAPNTISDGDLTICWLGPDEWLILVSAGDVDTLVSALEKALSGQHFALNIVSGGQLALELRGDTVRRTLAKGCTLDFHPSVFSAGMCAQSGLAKANVLIAKTADDDAFLLVVRRSFSDYLVRWLKEAA